MTDIHLSPKLVLIEKRGTNAAEFRIFLDLADDGKGGDITKNGAPLPTFDEWMER